MSTFNNKNRFLSALVLLALLLGIGLFISKMNNRPQRIDVWIEGVPYSSDPFDYDSFAHHVVFRSVFGSLVTQYKLGAFTGIIAESWTVSPDFKQWKFKIREGLRFENGDEISPSVVLRSLNRVGFVLKKRKSKSGFFEFLEGFEKLSNIESDWPGIRIDGQELVFTFIKPFKKTLETISFGTYSITHPSQYDQSTGEWLDKRKAISSGMYSIIDWNDKSLLMRARVDFLKTLRHERPINEINFVWDDSKRLSSQISMGTSDETMFLKSHEFFGGSLSEIGYIQCMSWTDREGPCFSIEARRELRAQFYRSLRVHGFRPKLSFFPTVMKGISEFHETQTFKENHDRSIVNMGKIRIRPTAFGNPIFSNGYNPAIVDAAKGLGFDVLETKLTYEKLVEESKPNLKHYSVDIAARGTGILIDDPSDDIRFMFLSKEGIQLPDTDGRIHHELEKPNFDPQVINALIWDQAVIWPVVHYASGLWAQKDLFDFSQLNLILPPTEFQWLGFK